MISRRETDILKGVALLLLLAHHLYACPHGEFTDYVLPNGLTLFHSLGVVGKICVALFVFLSGYGLTVQADANGLTLKDFYRRRFHKLYANYWIIWLIFVPAGIFIFGRTLESVYGDNAASGLLIDILGLYNIGGGYGYNATWWFYSCIILLYALFPLIYYVGRRYPIPLLLLSIGLYFSQIPVIRCIEVYLLPFVAGVLLAHNKLIISVLPPHKQKARRWGASPVSYA